MMVMGRGISDDTVISCVTEPLEPDGARSNVAMRAS